MSLSLMRLRMGAARLSEIGHHDKVDNFWVSCTSYIRAWV